MSVSNTKTSIVQVSGQRENDLVGHVQEVKRVREWEALHRRKLKPIKVSRECMNEITTQRI